MSEGYNGWRNYETWACKLWMDNSEGDQYYFREVCKDARLESEDEHGQKIIVMSAIDSYLEDLKEMVLGDQQASLMTDLLGASISSVDTYEIAENLLED